MSDLFGIGAGIKGAAGVYLRGARRSGRTQSLLDSLQDGDCVVCWSSKEADVVRRRAKEDGKDVELRVCKDLHELSRGTAKRRFILDHGWVEEYWLREMERIDVDLTRMQEHFTGYGEPHRETRRKAEELSKWRGLAVERKK